MTKKYDLTVRQEGVLLNIYKFISDKNYAPSIRELAEILGFSSVKGVSDHLAALEKKGYIQKKSLARSIRMTEKALWHLEATNPFSDKDILYLPLLGSIAAGKPIFAQENIEEYIPVSGRIMGKTKGQFLLKVRGDSMSGDHIVEGDTLIVKMQASAENGDIVVALVNNEAVVKRFYRNEEGTIELRSSNILYEPIIASEDLVIQGIVIAIYRNI